MPWSEFLLVFLTLLEAVSLNPTMELHTPPPSSIKCGPTLLQLHSYTDTFIYNFINPESEDNENHKTVVDNSRPYLAVLSHNNY